VYLYAVDVISVVLITLGFTFPNKIGISAAYTKLAYTAWALQHFLVYVYKLLALYKFYKVDEEDIGREEIFGRILNSLSVGLVALILHASGRNMVRKHHC
jgi:predicted ferric reductase